MVKTALLGSLLLLAPNLTGLVESPQKTPIIFDTDIGSDIDDAFALALVLNSPEFELVGVTTVSGDTVARARLAAKMLAAGGRPDVPVAAGESGKPVPCEQCRWAEGFTSPQIVEVGGRTSGSPLNGLAVNGQAVEFLRRQIERRPGELTLVPIGPLTNVGALFERYPDVRRKVKRIVLMGGSIRRGYEPGSGPVPEYNIAADAPAARVVFTSGVPIVMAPLDVTARLQLEAADRHHVFTRLTPLTDALTLLYHLWGQQTPTLHDPMAVGLAIDPALCETRALAVEVDEKGTTRVKEGQAPNAVVALETDPRKFIEFYLARVAAPPGPKP